MMTSTTLHSIRLAPIVFILWLLVDSGPIHAHESVKDKDREHWAFRRLALPPLPVLQHTGRTRTPVDAFLLAKLEDKGLTFAQDADRVALLRRVFLDLIGLP